MKTNKRISLSLALSLALGCMLSATAAAEVIYYDGTDTSLLKADPQYQNEKALYSDTSLSGNTITVDMGDISNALDGFVYGGINTTNQQAISGNGVNVSNATITHSVYGGYSNDSDITNNTVRISDSEIGGVTGGNSTSGNIANNIVTLHTTNVDGDVYGGASMYGNTDNNTVDISDSEIKGRIFGANSNTGNSNSNRVILRNTKHTDSGSYVTGGASDSGTANNNTIDIIGSELKGQMLYAGISANEANNNTINISGGSKISSNTFGGVGYTSATGHTSGTANNNTVNVIDSQMGMIFGGEGVTGANGNTVNVNNSTASNITGGSIGNNGTGNANNNTVSVINSTVKYDIYGGNSHTGDATGNTVSISNTNIASTSSIFGGFSGGSNKDVFTGNTLNWASKGTVSSVANFENYNFYIPANAQPGDTLLTIGGTDKTDLTKSNVKLVGIKGGHKWQVGESVALLDNQNGIDGASSLINGNVVGGLKTYKYDITKSADDKQLNATITGVSVSEKAKSLSEGRIAAIGFINSAVDLATGSGLQNAMDSSSSKFDIFGAMNYSDSKYNSGSHADVKGTPMLLGFSRKLNTQIGHWVVGAFLESGNSSYETFNSFDDAGDVRAHGKNNYFGGGIMARNVLDSGTYLEGSARVGRMSSDYDSRDIDTKYDTKSTYYGLHLGLGKLLELNKTTQLDVYGKYYWAHQGASSASVDGEDFNFDALNSHRLRVGARVNLLGGGNGIKTYLGLAYEHEFSGSARATYSGESIAAPSIKGGTGIGEIGMRYRPSSKSAFSMDVGLNGYVGKRQGIGGGVRLNWGF